MAHNYDIGTKAWQPDATEGWVASEVTSKTADGDKIFLVFSLANGEVCHLEPQIQWLPHVPAPISADSVILQTKTIETTAEALAEDNNPKLPPLMNPTMLEASDDLTNLSHLNEPAGMPARQFSVFCADETAYSSAGNSITVLAKRNIHI
jgi:myosin-5